MQSQNVSGALDLDISALYEYVHRLEGVASGKNKPALQTHNSSIQTDSRNDRSLLGGGVLETFDQSSLFIS